MAITDGVRIWRWSIASRQWIYTNREHQKTYVPAAAPGAPAAPGAAGWSANPAFRGAAPGPKPPGIPAPAAVPGAPALPTLEFLGGPGVADGDWCIEDLLQKRVTRIDNARVPATGSLWAWKGGKWSRIYKRSTAGYEQLPDYVAAIEGADGEILIDTGNLLIPDGQPENPDLKVVILRRDGQVDEAEMEYVAVPDNVDPPAPDLDEQWGIVAIADDGGRGQQDIEAVVRAAGRIVDQKDTLGRMLREYLEMDPADSRTKQLGSAIVKLIDEATPSPTPGTTAPIDTTLLVNDYVVAAGGFDDKGKPIDGNTNGIDAGTADGMKLAGELLAGCGAALNYARELKAMIQLDGSGRGTTTGERQFLGELNTKAGNAAMSAPKAVSGLFAATDHIANLVDKTATFSQSTSAVAQGMPFVGTALGAITFLRSARKAHRARVRYSKYKKLLKGGDVATEEMRHCLNYAVGKTFRKTRTMGATATTALVGASGSTMLGATALLGAANVWNPVGWTLLGVAAVGGIGIVGYKVYKRATRKKRHEKREQKYGGIKTPADLANKLVQIAGQRGHADREKAELMLESFGVVAAEMSQDRARAEAAKAIARHLK
jgi:hypothetical protein